MLDTVKLRSPYIDEDAAAAVTRALSTRKGYDGPTGLLKYEVVGDELRGSYDHRVRVALLRKKHVKVEGKGGKTNIVLEDCPPYLEIEGSVHKAMLGHNVCGGPVNIHGAVSWFVFDVMRRLDYALPSGGGWQVRRLDWAECYLLGETRVRDYLYSLRQAAYPRRKVDTYGGTGIAAYGFNDSTKFYHKGPEFRKHDAPRLRKAVDSAGSQWYTHLQMLADQVLRCEVELRAPLLDRAFGRPPLVHEITREWVAGIWENRVHRVLREGKTDVEIVRTNDAVKRRLIDTYGSRGGRALYATWVALAHYGEDRAREDLPRATFYRHRKMLVDAGCSWRSTDVAILDNPGTVPPDFAPTLLDRRRMVGVDPQVARLELVAA
jgi:II/X family phage/plasmid replication protein